MVLPSSLDCFTPTSVCLKKTSPRSSPGNNEHKKTPEFRGFEFNFIKIILMG